MTRLSLSLTFDKRYRLLVDRRLLSRVVKTVLAGLKVSQEVELGLVVTGDRKVRELNREYRGLDRTTDVLSFALGEEGEQGLEFVTPPDGVVHAGEVVISFPRAKKQARDYNVSIDEELARLVIHGTLHLLGQDHQRASERKRMRELEDSMLRAVFERQH